MTTMQFRATNFKGDTLRTIRRADEIIAEYAGQKLTARQVYYQFVSRNLIPNSPRSYQNLTSILTDARYAGMIAWDAIEDRGREPSTPGEWGSIDEIVDIAIRQFRLPRWADQPTYVELWVEKQALAGVLAPLARKHHVTLMVNKGYSSASAMKESADRMIEACEAEVQITCDCCGSFYEVSGDDRKCDACGERCKPKALAVGKDGADVDRTVAVLYLGDHDPSGEDMVRDIEDRLSEFGVPNLEVIKLGLTMAQIKKFNPPPNPAKISDSRAKGYIEKYGDQSWELDALPPRVLNQLVDAAIGAIIDTKKMAAVIANENKQRAAVTAAIAKTRKLKKGSKK